MKKILAFLFTVFTFYTAFIAESQNTDRFPRLHDRIIQAKLHEIRVNLKLNDVTFNRFRPVYLNYEREVSEIDFFKMARLMKVEADSLSTDEAEQLIASQLETAKKLITLREKYYNKFKTVLSPQQIIKLYQTEAEVRRKVTQELKRRIINRK